MLLPAPAFVFIEARYHVDASSYRPAIFRHLASLDSDFEPLRASSSPIPPQQHFRVYRLSAGFDDG